MKKLLFAAVLAITITVPMHAVAEVNIGIGIGLPPPVVFQAPPEVVVLPDTPDVYVVPTIDVDLYFWGGWWWRFWNGGWYRSAYYDRGWGYYRGIPTFYYDVDPGWRGYYRSRNWYGHRWNYERIPYNRLQRNWKTWHDNGRWEKRRNWDVQGYHGRPQREREDLRHQREDQYRRNPDVQRHEQWRQEQERRGPGGQRQEQQRGEQRRGPGAQQPQEQHRGRGQQGQQPQRQERERQHDGGQGRQHDGGQDHERSQGGHEGGEMDHGGR